MSSIWIIVSVFRTEDNWFDYYLAYDVLPLINMRINPVVYNRYYYCRLGLSLPFERLCIICIKDRHHYICCFARPSVSYHILDSLTLHWIFCYSNSLHRREYVYIQRDITLCSAIIRHKYYPYHLLRCLVFVCSIRIITIYVSCWMSGYLMQPSSL